ncbi:MAG TPA: cell division protein FtsA [Paracoccaceae bacterium]|nr:cell division protein FtsA [Paracoccaceae bacterium]
MSINLFQTQRELRHRREAAVRKGVIAVLDIGTSKVACIVLQFAPNLPTKPEADSAVHQPSMGAFRVVGVGTTQSRGVRFGEVVEMDETERAIRTAVQRAQKMAGIRVDHAFVCFSGGRPRSYGLSGETNLPNGEVAEADIGNAMFDCDVPPYGQGRQPLHAMPVCYKVDEHINIAEPRGRIGNKLSVDMHMVTVSDMAVQNIIQCVSRCDLELAGLVNSSFAAGVSSLSENEQELGAACIDMGAGSTGISVFIKKQMIYADAVRLGGDHISRDIQQGLHVPLDVAERIKTVNGGLVATGRDDRDFIEVPNPLAQWETDRRHVTRSELIGVMRPRVEEILEETRDRLDAAGFEYLPGQQIVLTGGSSEIPGLDQVASRILGRQCRIGKHLRVLGLPQAATTPGYAAAVGVSLHLSDPRDECWDFEMPMDRVGTLRLRRAVRWFRDHW